MTFDYDMMKSIYTKKKLLENRYHSPITLLILIQYIQTQEEKRKKNKDSYFAPSYKIVFFFHIYTYHCNINQNTLIIWMMIDGEKQKY